MPRRMKILLADDDPDILDAISRILKKANYDVIVEQDGSRLMTERNEWPDLILLDNKLSGFEGISICKHLKSQELTKDIPVILISASPDLEEKAHLAQANDYLPKPFAMKLLLDKIKAHLPLMQE
jgi:DNA-binding response OmpR family regulator